MSKVPKIGSLLNFYNILRKSLATAFLCYIVVQNIQLFYGVPAMFIVSYFWVVVLNNGHGLLDQGTLKSVVSQE